MGMIGIKELLINKKRDISITLTIRMSCESSSELYRQEKETLFCEK